MEAASWPWPEHVMLHPSKIPRFVTTPAEFLRELQLGNHHDQIVVFPGGVQAIGQDAAIGLDIQKALGFSRVGEPPTAADAWEVLQRLEESGALGTVKGKVAYRQADNRLDVPTGGSMNGALAPKWEALQAQCPEDARNSVYISEIRRLEAEKLEHGKKRKSTMQTTMRERAEQLGMQVDNFLHWDDYSEGFFVGANNSGYGLHVDCIPSSNVGSVFAGHKLLAIWKYPDESRKIKKLHSRELFVAPLSQPQVNALERACAVAIAPPGSIYIFSGAVAHAVANVGFTAPSNGCAPRPSIVASSYEAFVGLNLQHLEVLANTCEDASDSDSDIEDFEDDVATAVKGMAWRLINGDVTEEEAARRAISFMRERSRRVGNAVDALEEKLEASVDDWPSRRRRRRRLASSPRSTSGTGDEPRADEEV